MKSLLLIFIVCGALHAMDTELIEIKVVPSDAINNESLAWGYPQSLQGCDSVTHWEERLKTAEVARDTTVMLKTMHHINTQSINKQQESLNLLRRDGHAAFLVGVCTFTLLVLHTTLLPK